MSDILEKVKFKDVNLDDPFFDNLKQDYKEFYEWFQKKRNDDAYIYREDNTLIGFLYVKIEDGSIDNYSPPLPDKKRLKIGTFKIDAHGTKLGERFIKKSIDHAIEYAVKEIYLTIFPKHSTLINLLKEFGFHKKGIKISENGEEIVFLKNLENLTGNIHNDYPLLNSVGCNKYVLSIYPEWHTQLFPDSILNNETYDIIEDVSHTNSIKKTYICFMELDELKAGDIIIIYRTKDDQGPAWYRSVITSVCTVDDVRNRASFSDKNEYIQYTEKFSVFDKQGLSDWWERRGNLFVIKMLYNAAFSKRLIRKDLVENIGIENDIYWGFFKLSESQYRKILDLGGINERFIVN